MKKNISINLFGTLYQIDEDAYNLLERYLDSMKSYFSRQEGGDEIADDIEHRVAELLWQEKEKGAEAVNINMIKDIIGVIGDPAQIDNENPSTTSEGDTQNNTDSSAAFTSGINDSEPLDSHPGTDGHSGYNKSESSFQQMSSNIRGRRLYRDLRNKLLGGVCSGISAYVGGDVTFWRLGIVVLTVCCWSMDFWIFSGFLNWFIPLTYLVLWFVVPVARTPEDHLRMRGQEINPQNLNEEILKESAPQQAHMYDTGSTAYNNNDGCLKVAGVGCLVVLLIPFLLGLIPLLFALPIFSGIVSSGLFSQFPIFGGTFAPLMESLQGVMWIMLLCGFLIFLLPIYLLIHWLRGSSKPLSGVAITIILLVWLAALIGGIYLLSSRLGEAAKNGLQLSTSSVSWTVPGINVEISNDGSAYDLLDDTDRGWSHHNDWNILSNDFCYGLTSTGEYMDEEAEEDDSDEFRYIHCESYDGRMNATVEQSESVQEAGIYRLRVATRAYSFGAYIFARVGNSIADAGNVIWRGVAPIPAYNNTGGPIWKWAKGECDSVKAHIPAMSLDRKERIAEANCGEGYGWAYVVIENIPLQKGQKVYYGATTEEKYTEDDADCTWFSAADFELEKVKDL